MIICMPQPVGDRCGEDRTMHLWGGAVASTETPCAMSSNRELFTEVSTQAPPTPNTEINTLDAPFMLIMLTYVVVVDIGFVSSFT